jgi:hypothetical protein
MERENSHALKEWASVVRALTEGAQVLLLRKGGIIEETDRFVVERREFFLYPTYEHQRSDLIRPDFREFLRKAADEQPPETEVHLGAYAVVDEVIESFDLGRLEALSSEYIWTTESVVQRMAFKPELPMSVLLLRVHTLPEPCSLKVTKAYRGCKSWVTLEGALSTRGASPVLPEAEFRARVRRVKDLLGDSAA